jgi:polyisoprenoid-binding protein YceI
MGELWRVVQGTSRKLNDYGALLVRRAVAPLGAALLAGACGLPGSGSSATPSAPAAASGTSVGVPGGAGAPARLPPLAAPPPGAVVFTIVPEQSRATFRVREQLVGVQVPTDAVGTTGAVSGQIVLRREGGVAPDASRVTVDLRDLRTDDPRRDSYIKQVSLRTNEFPLAEFAPQTAAGLPNPLPASGEHAFRLTGPMVMRGVARDVTWDVTARRAGAQLTARATTSVKFGDFGMAPPRAEPVLMVVDEIRLELELAARQS